jgi:hypothetical protein
LLARIIGINYVKVEEASYSASFRQIIGVLAPGQIKFHKLNYTAIIKAEIAAKYIIFQEALNPANASRDILIGCLISSGR